MTRRYGHQTLIKTCVSIKNKQEYLLTEAQDNGEYVMYYTARRRGGNHCIGAATSTSVLGPYTPQGSPLVCDDENGGVIDPAGYDDGADRWLLWKVDGNSLGGATTCQPGSPMGSYYYPTPIKIQKMARDALTRSPDGPKTILDHEGRNNNGIVEAPTLYKVPGGDFVLFYSAHCFASDDYDVEYAWSRTVDGSYGDRGILFRTSDGIGIFGPGHADIDSNGVNMVFHGRTSPNEGGGGSRLLYSATLNFDGRRISY
jgi:beta-xylosidase